MNVRQVMKTARIFLITAALLALSLPTVAFADGLAGLWQADNGDKVEIQPDSQKVVITVHKPGGQRIKFGGWWTTPGRAFQFRVKGLGLVSCVMDGDNPNVIRVETRHGPSTWQRMDANPPQPQPPQPAGSVAGLWRGPGGEKIELQPDPGKVVVTVHMGGGQKARFGGWWTAPGRAFQFRIKGEGVVSCTLDGGNPNVMHVQSRHGRETWQRMAR